MTDHKIEPPKPDPPTPTKKGPKPPDPWFEG